MTANEMNGRGYEWAAVSIVCAILALLTAALTGCGTTDEAGLSSITNADLQAAVRASVPGQAYGLLGL